MIKHKINENVLKATKNYGICIPLLCLLFFSKRTVCPASLLSKLPPAVSLY